MNNLFSQFAFKTYRMVGLIAYPFMGRSCAFVLPAGKKTASADTSDTVIQVPTSRQVRSSGFMQQASGNRWPSSRFIEHVNALGINTIMTTGTVTSAQVVRNRLPRSSFHQYVPLDLKPALKRFLDHWQPDLAIFTESEIWPMTILELAQRNVPRILLNARMSDRSFKRWKNASGLAEALFDNFSHVIAQSDVDAERFRRLGAPAVDVSGNLKVDTDALPYNDLEFQQIRKRIDGRPCWVACSTHEEKKKP